MDGSDGVLTFNISDERGRGDDSASAGVTVQLYQSAANDVEQVSSHLCLSSVTAFSKEIGTQSWPGEQRDEHGLRDLARSSNSGPSLGE